MTTTTADDTTPTTPIPETTTTQQHETTAVTTSDTNNVELSNDKDAVKPVTAAATSTEEDGPPKKTWKRKLYDFYWTNEFLILVIVSICLAKAYPPLGAKYLAPKITATWISVIFIFFMAGLSLQTKELSKAFQRLKFNAFVQVYNFGVCSSIAYGIGRALESSGALNKDLAAGMIICGCLPMTINMVLILTIAANGDDAAAIFNCAVGNMIGVVLSPVLILGYLGVSASVDIGEIFFQLTVCVIVPVIVGQIAQQFIPAIVEFAANNKFLFKQSQQYSLIFIVYTVFCKTFSKPSQNTIGQVFLMILFQFILLIFFMVVAWHLLKLFFPKNPRLRVMGLYGCSYKSVATGIPLITAIYGGSQSIGSYTLPLLIWHPMQLMVGTFLTPRLAKFVSDEQQRLGLDSLDRPLKSDDNDDVNSANESNDANNNNNDENVNATIDNQQQYDEESPAPVTEPITNAPTTN